MRMVALVAVMAAGSSVAQAQTAGTVTEYGIYSTDRKLLTTTRHIPLRAGVRFGFCFEVPVESREDSTMLVETLTHPSVSKNGVEDIGYSVPRMFRIDAGRARGCTGYVARTESELAAGRWKFSLSDGGADLVVQEFRVE